MVLNQLRWFAIAVTIIALVSNGLSASLFQRFSDQLFWSPDGLVFYNYFATFVSVVGVFGSIKQHAYSMSIFANFFILDTFVSALSRSILLYILSALQHYICRDQSTTDSGPPQLALPHSTPHQPSHGQVNIASTGTKNLEVGDIASSTVSWDTDRGCIEMMRISFLVGWVSLAATTVMQMFFAILVRRYANSLFCRQVRGNLPEEGRVTEPAVWEKDGLPLIDDLA